MRGKLIVLEGIHGAGKTTTAIALRAWLTNSLNLPCLILSEMANFLDDELVNIVFKSKRKPSKANVSKLVKHYQRSMVQVIRDARDTNTWVIADRYALSLSMYLNPIHAIDSPYARFKEEMHWPLPDYSYILDCPVETARGRCTTPYLNDAKEYPNKYWEALQNRYRLVTEGFSDYQLVDSSGSIEDIIRLMKVEIGMGIDDEIERDQRRASR